MQASPQRATFDRSEFSGPVAFFNFLLEVRGAQPAWYDMVGKDLGQHLFILGPQQSLDRASRKLCESFVRGCKDGKRSRPLQSIDQSSSFDGSDQCGVVGRVKRVVNNVFSRIHLITQRSVVQIHPPQPKPSEVPSYKFLGLLELRIEPCACVFLVGSRVLVPCSKTWNNLEQIAVDRLF